MSIKLIEKSSLTQIIIHDMCPQLDNMELYIDFKFPRTPTSTDVECLQVLQRCVRYTSHILLQGSVQKVQHNIHERDTFPYLTKLPPRLLGESKKQDNNHDRSIEFSCYMNQLSLKKAFWKKNYHEGKIA